MYSRFLLVYDLADGASASDVDQTTCQETLENLVQAFQKVVDLQSKVSKSIKTSYHSNIINGQACPVFDLLLLLISKLSMYLFVFKTL